MSRKIDVVKLYYGPLSEYKLANFVLDLTPDGVLVATMNNPNKLNSFDGVCVAEFFFITEFAEREADIKVVIWTGSGRAFSAGANFANLNVSKSHPIFDSIQAYGKAGKGLRRYPDVAMKSWLYRMLEFTKISICAVNGIAIGGGANFALLMHDFVLVADSVGRFRYPFAELGIPPEMGSSFLFPRAFAKRFVMTGDWFDGRDAEKHGLVYKVVPVENLMKESLVLATRLAKDESLQGMMMSKRIINDRILDQLNHYRVCDIENETIDKALKSEYTIRSIQRFVAKHGKPSSATPTLMISASRLLHVCIDAGRLAAERIRTIQCSGDLQCIEKGNGQDSITGRPMRDIQTEADRKAEQIIFCRILREFPAIRIIGEEQSSGTPPDCEDTSIAGNGLDMGFKVPENLGELDLADISIFVDPLDGTSEFVKGRLHCVSVIIGIAYKAKAFAGVIYRPFVSPEYPHTYMYGVVSVGSFLDGRKMDANMNRNNPIKLTTTLSKSNRIIERVYELLQPCEEAKDGGAGWKCWLAATGAVECYQYPRPGTKRWDVLAGDAILRALGGACTDAVGRDIDYSVSHDYTNTWGILLSLNRQWHYTKLVPVCHRALNEAANDPKFTQWPHGLTIPPIDTSSL